MYTNDGEKFKQLEREFEMRLDKNKFFGIRLDGRAFHTFTKGFNRPYDMELMNIMDEAVKRVITDVLPEALFGYTQSDEITVYVAPNEHGHVFNGKVQKIVSVAASTVSAVLAQNYGYGMIPAFDGRVFQLDSLDEIHENLTWRRLDARKNAITMAAHALYGHKKLEGVSTRERIEMLQGTEFERLPEGFMNGRIVRPVSVLHSSVWASPTGETRSTTTERNVLKAEPATRELAAQLCGVAL